MTINACEFKRKNQVKFKPTAPKIQFERLWKNINTRCLIQTIHSVDEWNNEQSIEYYFHSGPNAGKSKCL